MGVGAIKPSCGVTSPLNFRRSIECAKVQIMPARKNSEPLSYILTQIGPKMDCLHINSA
jgi:hypothetical protein